MGKMLLLNCNTILCPRYIMTGARSCNGLSSELYIPFDFQAKILLLTCFIILNVGWKTNIFCEPSSSVKIFCLKKKTQLFVDICLTSC